MNENSRKTILLVDDDPGICEALGMILREEGYQVVTASDGFDALAQIKLATPDVLVSDLNMPRMSGHELLAVVRQRFTAIPVIAMSGDYDSNQRFPGGVVADAFFAKGKCHPEELLLTIATLLQTAAPRPISHPYHPDSVQTPRYGKDSKGTPFIMVTCCECMRSFQVGLRQTVSEEIQKVPCPFCVAQVRYAGGYSVSSATPQAVSSGQTATIAA